MPEPREQFVAIDGVRVRYLEAGDGPPLLLIHGLLGYAFSWRRNIAEFSRTRKVVALDLPGLGYSDRVVMDCSLRALAGFLRRFMDAVGISTAEVIGTSHGGALAMRLALDAPQRVRSLVLVASVNPWSRAGRKRIAVLGSGPGGVIARLLLPKLLPHLQRVGLERMYGDRSRIPAGTLAGYAGPLAVPGTADHALRILRCWQSDVSALASEIPRLAVPALLLWGSRDSAVPVASAYALQQHLPQAQLVVLEGVGHLPYEEAPEEFNRAVLSFLSSQPSAASVQPTEDRG